MIHNDKQLGKPNIVYKATKAQITAMSGLETGSFAMATDTNELGYLDSGGWKWYSSKGMYIPITPIEPTDSASHSWSPYAAPVGTYTFRPQDNSNAWPTTASAIHVLILGRWATASNSNILNLRQTSGGTNHLQIRALSATIGLNVNGNVSLDGSGYFYATVEGADLAVGVVRILGYYT